MPNNRILFIITYIYLLALTGCSGSNSNSEEQPAIEQVSNRHSTQLLADPSLKKCLDDGYKLIPIKQDGIVRSYMCVNPLTNLKCDSWLYFHNKCSLTIDK